MSDDIIQKIALNFLPIEPQEFSFTVFRRLANPQEKKWSEDISIYKLPNEEEEYKPYWVSFNLFDGTNEYIVQHKTNNDLTKRYLYNLLLDKINVVNSVKVIPKKEKYESLKIWFEIESLEEGQRTIWMEPYYLKSKDKFGFLIGFKFLKEKNQHFNKKVQILSFSLNEDGRSNTNYHIDIYNYIQNFITKHLKNFRELSSDTISISNRLETISNELLKTKTYIFANNETDNSQFNGVMKYGVFEKVNYESIKYIYLFEEKYKDLANDLFKALNGETFVTFNGIEKLNLSKQDKSNVIALRYNNNTDEAIDKINKEINTNNEKVIVISILPAKDEEFYYRIKKACLDRNIPLQVVHVETIQDTNKLKWSVSGIGLQIFVKLGGTPWLVEPSNQNCLIVGLGQSIQKDENGNLKKYRTYSVLLDSSGKFLTIEPLSDNDDLEEIGNAVKSIIDKYNNYEKIAFHIPQKIKKEIIEKIEMVLKENQNIELTIIRINDDSKFFGFNISENSLVPFESTFVQLGSKEYLLWPEGLNYHNKKVSKRYGNPLYVEFYYSNNKNINHKSYLQDILNLSGANYRGFNAKFLPVSIYYPKLISGFNKNFDRFNIEQVTKKNNMLWFI